MKETKVYVDELPESCSKCLFCYDNRPYWKSTDCIINHKELDEDEIETSVNKNCPLHSIKDHDRELMAKVLEKTKTFVRENTYICGVNATREDIITSSSYNQALRDVLDFLGALQKELEK